MIFSEYYSLREHVGECIENNKYNEALAKISEFVWRMMNSAHAGGNVIGSKKLDLLCESVGKSFLDKKFNINSILTDEFSRSNVVIIVCTGLYKNGGTSHVVNDLIAAHENMSSQILVTNTFHDMKEEDKNVRIKEAKCEIEICKKSNLSDKMYWLIDKILKIKPSRILILNHNQDSVIISAVSAIAKLTKVLFYHHADYNLCLGVHMSDVTHIDPHNIGFYNCREVEGLAANVYLPLCVEDQKSTVNLHDSDLCDLTTCSSASYHKFANFYLYPYDELVILRLQERGGRHIHIGKIPKYNLQAIKKKLIDNKIDPFRFKVIDWVPNLWRALVELKVDLFISSFPHSSGRTSIEVMGAGVPILFHDGYLTRFHVGRDIVYPGVMSWRYPEDFVNVVGNVTKDELISQAAMSRGFYLENYSLSHRVLGRELDLIVEGRGNLVPPPLLRHQPDNLDKIMHHTHLSHLNANLDTKTLFISFMKSRSLRLYGITRFLYKLWRNVRYKK